MMERFFALQMLTKKLFVIIFIFLIFSTLLLKLQVHGEGLGPLTFKGLGFGTSDNSGKVFELKPPTEVLKAETGVDVKADDLEFIGDNLVAKNNVSIRKGDLVLYSDMVILNKNTKNVELSGNVRFHTLASKRLEIEYWDLKEMQKSPYTKLKVVGTVLSPSGRQKLVVDIIEEQLSWRGNRAAGNLKTGIFEFGKFVSKFGNWYALGEHAIRKGDGKIVIDDATITPCESILDGNSAYSIESSKMVAIPPSGSCFPGKDTAVITDDGGNLDKYHFWAYSNIIYIGSVPVFWLPVIYKPPKGDFGKWGITVGATTDLGVFVQTTNYWNIVDNDDVSLGITNMIDFYSSRGLALGNRTELYTKETQTDFFVYGLYDFAPMTEVPVWSRFRPIDNFRYGLQLKNISNITDRMSFRGNLSKLSDIYFLYDFFDDIAQTDPQPATYGNLNYQFDYASVNLALRPRINDFFSVVEELPSLDIVVPRQELFENINYQSETSMGYYNMKWRNFKVSRSQEWPGVANDGPSDYGTFRFDTLHFLYYPLRLDWLNAIPRAGIRLTAYGDSSSTPISSTDLDNMIKADAPEGRYSGHITNYTGGGGGQFRFIPELGFQVNSKISRSWTDVKNAYFDFNGLRHVAEPYVDYTFIGKPTVNRDKLYYFDDIDRIDQQNWVRVGLQNRLQTRRGSWGDSQVYTWATMENYVDFIFTDRENCGNGWKNLGGIGTKLSIMPYSNLSFNMEFLIEGSKLSVSEDFLKAIQKASFAVNWDFAENWGIAASYYFGNEGVNQGIYSMGSNVSTVQAGSVFMRTFSDSSYINTTLKYELNDRTSGLINLEYDFNQNLMPNLSLAVVRELPGGLELMLNLSCAKKNNTTSTGIEFEYGVGGSLSFSSTPSYMISPRESLLPESIVRTPF
jgi:lipopolysaccharide assembly outer membrane protein LptD (OstA)